MTVKEIVKALEDLKKCNANKIDCDKCTLGKFYPRCSEEIGEIALDLINRLQGENERLKNAKYIFSTVDYCADDLDKALKENEELKTAINGFRGYEEEIKAEAYKECIEKVKEKAMIKYKTIDNDCLYELDNAFLDNVLKELIGE